MDTSEMIQRAREAAYRKSCDWAAGGVNVGDAALRSLLTDLRELMLAQDLWEMRADNGRREIYDGISALLRELGDE